jgi:hypothetical protein
MVGQSTFADVQFEAERGPGHVPALAYGDRFPQCRGLPWARSDESRGGPAAYRPG